MSDFSYIFFDAWAYCFQRRNDVLPSKRLIYGDRVEDTGQTTSTSVVVDQRETPKVFVIANQTWGLTTQVGDRLTHLTAVGLQGPGEYLDALLSRDQVDAHRALRAVGIDLLQDRPLHQSLVFFRQGGVSPITYFSMQHQRA